MDNSKPQDEASGDVIQAPEPAHVHEEHEAITAASITTAADTDSDPELEATELRTVDNTNVKNTLPRLSHILSPGKPQIHWYDPAKKFWRHHIRISVPHEDCRDHLANERTFLGYLRTSIALSMLGTIIAQLYRLQHSPNPSKVFGFFVLSKPLSVTFQGAALCMVLLGGIRFWRQQSAMAIGRVHAGGWEFFCVAVGSFLLLFMLLVVHVALDIYKDANNEPYWGQVL